MVQSVLQSKGLPTGPARLPRACRLLRCVWHPLRHVRLPALNHEPLCAGRGLGSRRTLRRLADASTSFLVLRCLGVRPANAAPLSNRSSPRSAFIPSIRLPGLVVSPSNVACCESRRHIRCRKGRSQPVHPMEASRSVPAVPLPESGQSG